MHDLIITLSFLATVIGATILASSLLISQRIKPFLPQGQKRIRKNWFVMEALTCFFMVGYLGYIVFLLYESHYDPHFTSGHLIISLVFFFGSIFVLLTVKLAEMIIKDIRQVAKLKAETAIDPLTGILNRRYFFKLLRRKIDRLQSERYFLSIAIIDLDNFKEINDRYGHLVGDKVLLHVCETIRQNLREQDLLGRYGGDEILIALLGNKQPNEAKKIIERIRSEVENRKLLLDENGNELEIKVTVSAGLSSSLCQLENNFIESLVKKADENLYRAKTSGKNKVIAES
jgi:diguanylate cyclase (GGDEF)-like protein